MSRRAGRGTQGAARATTAMPRLMVPRLMVPGLILTGLMAAMLIMIGSPALAHHSFDDVGHESVFHGDVEALAASGITKGCSDRAFCPEDPVTRGQMAAFLRRGLEGMVTVGAPVEFVDDDDSEFEADIEWLAATGITKGCGADRFCPDDLVTRGQMAAFLHRGLGGIVEAGELIEFTDDDDSVFEADIEWLAATGITKGCGDGVFCPEDRVTRQQMAAFLTRALDLPMHPLFTARLEGRFDVAFTVVTSDGFDEPGDVYDLVAAYRPDCPTGPCDTIDDEIDVVYGYDRPSGTYRGSYEYDSDCLDQNGDVVVAGGYRVTAVDVIWATDTDIDGHATALAGEVSEQYRASSVAVQAGCDAAGGRTFDLQGVLQLDQPGRVTDMGTSRAGLVGVRSR